MVMREASARLRNSQFALSQTDDARFCTQPITVKHPHTRCSV